MKLVNSEQSPEFSEKVSSYRDLVVWQKSLTLVKLVYEMTKQFPKDETFILVAQLKRCSISIVSNIAEGSSKRSTKEFVRFLNISYGSLSELQAQIEIAFELNFVSKENFADCSALSNEIGKMLNGLIRSLMHKLNSEL